MNGDRPLLLSGESASKQKALSQLAEEVARDVAQTLDSPLANSSASAQRIYCHRSGIQGLIQQQSSSPQGKATQRET